MLALLPPRPVSAPSVSERHNLRGGGELVFAGWLVGGWHRWLVGSWWLSRVVVSQTHSSLTARAPTIYAFGVGGCVTRVVGGRQQVTRVVGGWWQVTRVVGGW